MSVMSQAQPSTRLGSLESRFLSGSPQQAPSRRKNKTAASPRTPTSVSELKDQVQSPKTPSSVSLLMDRQGSPRTPREGTGQYLATGHVNHLKELRRQSVAQKIQERKAETPEPPISETLEPSPRPRKLISFKQAGAKTMVAAPTVIKRMRRQVEPFVKFRRIARAVKLLIQVCHVCKGLLADSVAQEAWFALVDNLAAAAALTQDKKKGRAFITFVPNEQRELVQVSFDITEYMRHKTAEDYLTDDIRRILQQRPGTRSEEQLLEAVKCLKGLCKPFNDYPLAIQKQICQQAFFDKYRDNRVILRGGLAPDGIYFVLSGQLIEKPEGKKQPIEINAGEKFGEEDLVCGGSRRGTVLTKHEVELLFLHRFDYRVIFNMSTDSCDPKNLDICRNDVVFQHFPMQKLLDNPGTWSALKYKYGRLIVKDSNELEWVYVIKSGEARVLKHLEPGRVDVKSRRKKIQQTMEEQSPYHRKKRILDFIADGTARPSIYNPTQYHPGKVRPHSSFTSAAHKHCMGDFSAHRRGMMTSPLSRRGNGGKPKNSPQVVIDDNHGDPDVDNTLNLPDIKTVDMSDTPSATEQKDDVEDEDVMVITMDDIKAINEPKSGRRSQSIPSQIKPSTGRTRGSRKERLDVAKRPSTCNGVMQDGQRFANTPASGSTTRRSARSSQRTEEESLMLPPFVQIETLHPGQTFGLRACLDQEERGPSVSLVSGECEILAINKKFFMKHCDDALYSLIRLKAKPFPSQTELVDRLDANMQWEEFKQSTMKEFLRHRVRTAK